MIRIVKSYSMEDVPVSLKPAYKELFHPKPIPRPSKTTTARRDSLIAGGAYIDNDRYNARYKTAEIKKALCKLYKRKCAFCEARIEQFHVEHYRPKQIYPWLAYSWDNLLCACATCNEHKGIDFQITGVRAVFVDTLTNRKNINGLSAGYDATELPDLVNPEVTDPEGHLNFETDGNILSHHPRFHYTLNTCQIFRTDLNDRRLHILQTLRVDLKAAFVDNLTKADQDVAINTIARKFIRDSKDVKNEFLAFRRYVVSHWLTDEIKNAKS